MSKTPNLKVENLFGAYAELTRAYAGFRDPPSKLLTRHDNQQKLQKNKKLTRAYAGFRSRADGSLRGAYASKRVWQSLGLSGEPSVGLFAPWFETYTY